MAQAFYGLLRPKLDGLVAPESLDDIAARFAIETDGVIEFLIRRGESKQ